MDLSKFGSLAGADQMKVYFFSIMVLCLPNF